MTGGQREEPTGARLLALKPCKHKVRLDLFDHAHCVYLRLSPETVPSVSWKMIV